MNVQKLYRASGIALVVGAAIAGIAIALEALTDPVDPLRRPNYVEALAAPVHVALFVAALLVMLGLVGVFLRQRERAGRLGFAAFLSLFFAVGLGELPHTVLDMAPIPALYDELGEQEATRLVEDRMYAAVAPLGMIALLLFLAGVVALAVATLRARVLPAWPAIASLVGLALGIVVAPVLSVDSIAPYLPHPPVFVYLGIIGYGWALATGVERSRSAERRPASATIRKTAVQ